MNHSCHIGSSCMLMSVGLMAVWWLVASALLRQTWNRVVVVLMNKAKPASYCQALLLLATVVALMAPACYLKRKAMHCDHHQACHKLMDCSHHENEERSEKGNTDENRAPGSDSDKNKGDCPYSH